MTSKDYDKTQNTTNRYRREFKRTENICPHKKNLDITIYKNITHNSQNIDRSNQNVQSADR